MRSPSPLYTDAPCSLFPVPCPPNRYNRCHEVREPVTPVRGPEPAPHLPADRPAALPGLRLYGGPDIRLGRIGATAGGLIRFGQGRPRGRPLQETGGTAHGPLTKH